MEAVSTQKFIHMSPRKLRLVADMVRGKAVAEVLEILPFVQRRAALPIQKVVKSAAANAQVKGASLDTLKISRIEVSEGPRLKRFRPVSRGQAHGYVKTMSHIKVVVTTQNSKEANSKLQKSTKSQKAKKTEERGKDVA